MRNRKRRRTRPRVAARGDFFNSMLWSDTVASAKRFGVEHAAADSGGRAGPAHGHVSGNRRVLSAVHSFLRQDHRALGAADPVHRVRHRRTLEDHADRDRRDADHHSGYVQSDEERSARNRSSKASRWGARFRRDLRDRAAADHAARAEQHPSQSQGRSCCSCLRAR